ncbi:hypothetical protein [Bacillus sp. FJAT-45350]|uniref:hypothetical protein n=1 Tax=Bacillus sp. FJAT-45350 TaxID=2011014 RepID=UPI000BB79265|nr:hypothetical protein [Bacillus sp. FJAT-45350]
MNRFAYFSRDHKQTVLYVRSILPFISDIREIEIFHQKTAPYVEVLQNSYPTRRSVFYNRKDYTSTARKTSLGQQIKNIQVYTFVLRDDFYNEIWLYADPKKIETLEILHMVGLKDVKNFQNKLSYTAKDLKPNHDFNVLIEDDKEEKLMMARFTFPYACKRLKAVELLHSYGYLNPILTKHDYGEDFQYFEDTPIRNNETYDYATNNLFLFEEENVTYDNAEEILEYIAQETSGTVSIIDITS